jgi:hypothetical protein
MKATAWGFLGGSCLLFAVGIGTAQAQNPNAGAPNGDAAFGPPVSTDRLAGQRGGAETLTMNLEEISNEINENARLSGNRMGSNITTGANRISGGSFAGSSGISSVIQNTGNNVIIQDSTLVNITMKP